METQPSFAPKINIDELVKSFKVTNEDVFTAYLKEIWLVSTNTQSKPNTIQ